MLGIIKCVMMLLLGRWEDEVQSRLQVGKGAQEFSDLEDAPKRSYQVSHWRKGSGAQKRGY